MAIEFIREDFIKRAKGHNAVDFAAKRSNTKIKCCRTNKVFDYTKKSDCKSSQIILPTTAYPTNSKSDKHPFEDRGQLWNAIEEIESKHNRRATAQLAIEVIIALPKELDLQTNIELAHDFIKNHYVDKHHVVADVFINLNGDINYNAIAMLTIRKLEGLNFSKNKVRNITSPMKTSSYGSFVVKGELHAKWRDFQNDFFAKNNIDLQVDQTSFIPEKHVGLRGQVSERNIQLYNSLAKKESREAIINNPVLVLKTISSRKSQFNDHDIRSFIKSSVETQEDFTKLYQQVICHSSLLKIGKDQFNKDIFSFDSR